MLCNMKTYFGIYYEFVLQIRMELYDNLWDFQDRLEVLADIDMSVPQFSTIRAYDIEDAKRQLTKLAEGLK